MGLPTDTGRGPDPLAAGPGERTVTELVILLREGRESSSGGDADAGVAGADPAGPPQPATMDALVDVLWSAQYLAPGALCAFAGDAEALPESGGDGDPLPAPAATHALSLRFGGAGPAAAFASHPAFAGPAAAAVASGLLAAPPTVLAFTSRAPDDLEPLFRRGAEWEEGVDVCLAFSEVGSGGGAASSSSPGAAADADADAYLADLAALAESSLAGALQACPGRLVRPPSAAPAAWTHALLARFGGPSQAAAFLALPPLRAAAATGAGSSPLVLEAVEAWRIAPAAGGSQGPPPVGAPR
jgi:hypothetical protein